MVLFLEPGEKYKSLASVERLLRQMAQAGGDRGSLLIAFGGGIVGDVGGFLAAIFMRGIPYIQVPTTLLAQVDSSVGGKTGVNLPEGKNLVGSFYQPLAVFADIGVLGTLPERELRAGLMESIKAGIIRDRALVRFMEEHAARRAGARPQGSGKGDCGVDPDEGRGGGQGRARERAADDFEPGAHGGPRAGAGYRLQNSAARRGGGVGDGGCALSGAASGERFRRRSLSGWRV